MTGEVQDLQSFGDDDCGRLTICVCGRRGIGKSTLCNSIVGAKKFRVGSGLDTETAGVV